MQTWREKEISFPKNKNKKITHLQGETRQGKEPEGKERKRKERREEERSKAKTKD